VGDVISAILTFLTKSRLARLIGTVLAALAAVLTFGAFKKREGVTEERAREAQKEAEALQRGVTGAAEGRAKLRTGKTPQQIKEENDAKWD
jgi:hypothetical protein